MQCKLLAVGDDDKTTFIDVWLDEDKINGFYIPSDDDSTVNVFFGAECLTLLQNSELIAFLELKFKLK